MTQQDWPALPAESALVVDDSPLVSTLVAGTLEQFGLRAAVEPNVASALRYIEEFDPDLAVVDLALGAGPTGVDLVRSVRQGMPWIAVLILTDYRSPQLVARDVEALEDVPYVVKSDIHSTAQFYEAVAQALYGRSIPRPVFEDSVRITQAQAELLRLMAAGYSNAQIADDLNVTAKAVEHLATRLFRALGIPADYPGNPRMAAVSKMDNGKITVT